MLTRRQRDFHQRRASPFGGNGISLALEQGDRFFEGARPGCDLGEIGQRVGVVVDHVGRREERYGLARERLSLGVLICPRLQLRPRA